MTSQSSRSYLAIASAIVIAGVLISASLFVAMQGVTKTTTTTTETSVSTSTVTVTATPTYTNNTADCSRAQPPEPIGLLFGEVKAGTGSPAVICVQFYFFNPTTPLTLNLTSELTIQAVLPSGSFNAAPNFTVSVSQAQLVLGGSGNESEGALVAYTLTAKAGASGTYELGFLTTGWYLTYEPARCGYYGELVAGNGQPDYTNSGSFSGCITYTSSGTSSSSGSPTIPGIQYPILSGNLYFRVVGVTNSTQ